MITKKVKKAGLIISILIFCTQSVRAQDIMFSQFYSNPLYLNPALAGADVCPRLSLGTRLQWISVPNAYNTFFLSYDQYVDGLRGGIGVSLIADMQADGAQNVYLGSVMYSYRLQINRDLYMNFALEANIRNNALHWERLVFPNDLSGGTPGTTTPPESMSNWTPDFSAGTIIYGSNWYAGAAVAHLLQPSDGFYGDSPIPMKMTAHVGARLNTSNEERRTSPLGLGSPVISPNVIFQHQQKYNYFAYGLYADWEPFITGIWFRHGLENADAFIFLVGFQNENIRLGYSYDLTISQLANVSGGAHEITFGFKFPCPEKKKKIKKISCPSF